MESLTEGGITWQWHDSCGNCGCVANWHAFDIPEGATMVALPEKFPCKGFEFGGCPDNCETFVFQPVVCTANDRVWDGANWVHARSAAEVWEKMKMAARAKREEETNV